jgi:monooxygenase
MVYRGMMCSDVPNMAFSTGYTNASWTLKCDLTSRYVCRLVNYMDERGYTRCVPRRDPAVAEVPLIDFSSGYVQRVLDRLPKQGSSVPWKLYQNYARDLLLIERGKIADDVMEFGSR